MKNELLYYIWAFGHKIKKWKKECLCKKNVSADNKTEINTLSYIVNQMLNITQFPAATGTLRKKQLVAFSILQQIVQICHDHGLTYWLDFGTLIGAIRHKGFVPWDDDIDISMLREDYLRIIPLLKEKFKKSDFVVREGQGSLFQLRVKNLDNSIGVDIFPVDNVNFPGQFTNNVKSMMNYRLQLARRRFHSYIYWAYRNKLTKTHSGHNLTTIRQYAVSLASQFILDKNQRGGEAILFYGIDFPHDGNNFNPIHKDIVFPLQEIEFEGQMFSCPRDINTYLTGLYGDYMSFPKKISLHN